MKKPPVIKAIRNLEDVKASMENIRSFFEGQGNLLAEGDSIRASDLSTGNGSYKWKLGSLQTTAGLTLKTTGYVEIEINGAKVKLALVSL
jgi:hypothetical protein